MLSALIWLNLCGRAHCTKVRNDNLFSGGGLASPCWEFKGSQKTKSIALIKLVSFDIFRLIHYLHNWSLSTLKLPVQHLNSKSSFLANARIEDFNFKNEKSQVKKFFNFQLFVTFSPDSDSSAIKFFRIGC